MGMKEGAGDDPFAEDTDEAAEDSSTTERTEAPEPTPTTSVENTAESQTGNSHQGMTIPYKFRRSGVKDGRERVPLFLQESTKESEREAKRELEKRFEDDVSKTDLREALMAVGMENIDDVEAHLKEWGYGMDFDE